MLYYHYNIFDQRGFSFDKIRPSVNAVAFYTEKSAGKAIIPDGFRL